MDINDYYRLLELTPQASQEEIKQSYRRLARKFHPDVSEDPQAESKFKLIKEAYEILSNPQSRLAYNYERTVLKPYSYAWCYAKISEQLRLIAKIRARANAQYRVNAQFYSRKNTETNIPPSPMNTVNTAPKSRLHKKWLYLASGLIFIVAVMITTSMLLERVKNWRSEQKMIVAVLQNDETGVKNLESSDLATQAKILQYDGVKKALVNFYLTHPTEKELLSRLGEFDQSLQQELFADGDVQSTLLTYYQTLIDKAVKQDDFISAFKILESLKEKLHDSPKFTEQYESLRKQKVQRLSMLTQQYMACVEDSQAPLLERTHCMAEARTKIEQVGLEHTLPTDTNLPTLYANAIEQSLDTKNYTQVESLLADWEKLMPEASTQRDRFRDLLNQYRQLDTVAASLVSQDRTKIIFALTQATKLDEALQKELFNLPQVQQNLLLYHLEEALKLWKKQASENVTVTGGGTFSTEDFQKLVAGVRYKSATLPILPASRNTVNPVNPVVSKPVTTAIEAKEEANNQPLPPTMPTSVKIANLLSKCQEHFEANRLTTGDDDNGDTALTCYQTVLQMEPDNSEAQAGFNAIERRYQRWAETALQNNQLNKAKSHIATLERINPRSKGLAQLRQSLKTAFNRPKPESSSVERNNKSAVERKSSVERNPPVERKSSEERNPPVERKSSEESERTSPPAPPKIEVREIKKEPPPTKKPVKPAPNSAATTSDCSDLLRQLSIGVNPLTAEQRAYFQTKCR